MNKNIFILSAALLFIASCSEKKKEEKNTASTVSYQLAVVKKENVSNTIKLPAQLAAFEEVSIFPKVNGYVKEVLVDIGTHVNKGQLLMTLEAPELIQATVSAKEKFEKVKSDYALAKENYQRLITASKTAGAVSPLDLSSAKTKVEADSTLMNAEKANWQMQETMLSYLKVTAAFDGVVTERNVHPGALVSAVSKDKPMLELKQVKHLRLQIDLPEAVAANLKNNDAVNFMLSAFPGKKFTGHLNRKSMNVNTQLRTERVEVDVMNEDGSLAPGMYADVIIQNKANVEALSVPKSAVVTSTERKYVLAVRDNKAVKVDVITGNESADRIVVIGEIKEGEKIIAYANDEIKEGTIIKN